MFAQATDYRPGHYLTRHLDDPKGRAAQVCLRVGLHPALGSDWGGLLQFFLTMTASPTVSYLAGFNTLDLFDVRHIHSVTL